MDSSWTEAVELAAVVKARLVEFALSPAFEKHLRRIARDQDEWVDETDFEIDVVERLLFSFTYDDGSTVVDRFLRRPGLDDAERAMARGFLNGVDGFFEVLTDTAAAAEMFEVRCCISDLVHVVAPTLPAGIPALPGGSFLVGRLNPLADTDLWTPSGALRMLPVDGRQLVADRALDLAMKVPRLNHRNPEMRRVAADRVARTHETFLARHGGDSVLVAGRDLPQVFAEAMLPDGEAEADVVADGRAKLAGTVEDSELFQADHVLVHSHPVAGLGFYRDFVEVTRALESGADAAAGDLELLRGYLNDPGVPVWLLRKMVAERLPAAEAALAVAAGRREFVWERDGEALLASLPGDAEPELTLAIVPSISR